MVAVEALQAALSITSLREAKQKSTWFMVKTTKILLFLQQNFSDLLQEGHRNDVGIVTAQWRGSLPLYFAGIISFLHNHRIIIPSYNISKALELKNAAKNFLQK